MKDELTYLKKGAFGRAAFRTRALFLRAFGGFLHPKKAFKESKGFFKTALVLAYFIPAASNLMLKRIERGIVQLFFSFLFFWFLFMAGLGSFFGTGIFAELKALGQCLTIGLIFLALYVYPKNVSDVVAYIKHLNSGGIRASSVTKRALSAVSSGFKSFTERLRESFFEGNRRDKATVVCAFLLPGLSQILLKQFVVGLLKLALSIGLAGYLIMRGGSDIVGLVTLRTEGVKSNYNIVYGLIALFVLLWLFSLYVLNIVTSTESILAVRKGKGLLSFTDTISALLNKKLYVLFLALPVVGVLTFTILPLIYMISVAFTDFATTASLGVIPNTTRDIFLSWVGLETFRKLFVLTDYFKAFASVLSWTLIWAFLATFTCYFGGLFLAILINKRVVKWKVLFRSLFVLSMAVPQLVTLRVMYAMFHDFGPLNSLLLNMGLISERISFWGTVSTAKVLIICVNMWVGIPYFMLLMSGLLLNIPKDLYEYAFVEGAGRFYSFKKITMPFLLFMTTPLLIMNFVGNINNFNVIWLLTNGGPTGLGTGGVAGGTDILITWLYKLTMQHNPDYNIGSAIGIIMFIISAGLSLVIYRNSSSYKKEGDFS